MNRTPKLIDAHRLPAGALRWRCTVDEHPCLAASDQCPQDQTVAQDRAVEAIEFGIAIDSPGYNIFVTGLTGSGRNHTLEHLLRRIDTPCRSNLDLAYVNNFAEPARPLLLSFPQGKARAFRDAMGAFIRAIHEDLTKLFEDEDYRSRRAKLTEPYAERERKMVAELDEEITADGLGVVSLKEGPIAVQLILPVVDGKPVPFEIARAQPDLGLTKERLDELEAKATVHKATLERALRESQRLKRRAGLEIAAFERKAVEDAFEQRISELRSEFDTDGVGAYLDAVLEQLVAYTPMLSALEAAGASYPPDPDLFAVNVIREAPEDADAPIVVERHPSFSNVFGNIEREQVGDDEFRTNFTRISAGSMLRAQGGFLVMYANDVLNEPGVWRKLSRVLRSQLLDIEPSASAVFYTSSALKPEPIPIDVKVVLIGDDALYHMLARYAHDFATIFKVKAEFERDADLGAKAIADFASVIRSVIARESLRPIAADGLAALVEYGVRTAGGQGRLSTRFGEIADVVREASQIATAREPASATIDATSIDAAINARRRRQGLVDERLNRAIVQNILLVDTTGSRVGQINGLAVYGFAGQLFGKPSRITATAGAGLGGVVNIEREVAMSGPSHDKGVLILAGYLRRQYGQEHPLALTASIAFEQSYSGVDGDSASLAELFALLSAISGLPILQAAAITGSMNQLGDAQAIGGVNVKVEGFHAVCSQRGLTGEQGVIIPASNAADLMLDEQVIADVKRGDFAVWAVSTVDEAIGVLFGVSAEVLHRSVEKRLALWRSSLSPTSVRT